MENNSTNTTNDLTDKELEKLLTSKYEETKKESQEFDIHKTINEFELKINEKSKLISDEKKIQYLKIEDYDFLTYSAFVFQIEDSFDMICNKLDSMNIGKLKKQLDEVQLSQYTNQSFCGMLTQGKPNIFTLSSIPNMVESTYVYSENLRCQMAEEICYMQKIAFRWRSVGGDGNCFYRSVMFSYLENLIFQKDIQMIKKMIVDIEEKFNLRYYNTARLNNKTKTTFGQLNILLVLSILKIIYDSLDSINYKDKNDEKKKIKYAYEILIKSFNSCRQFDTVMIMYLRYILYEYILENKTKCFSEEFSVLLGNLLPMQYETDQGEFLFDKFFEEELLKLYTYAEKLAIYLTPYVLKLDLRVIFYDFGKDCTIQTKDFKSGLNDKPILMVLYRKSHYDIAYTKEYVLKNKDYMELFLSNEKLNVVDNNLIDYYREHIGNVDFEKSMIFTKRKLDISNNTTVTSENININIENITLPCKCILALSDSYFTESYSKTQLPQECKKCGHKNSLLDQISIFNSVTSFNDKKDEFLSSLLFKFKTTCMYCVKPISTDKTFYEKTFKNPEVSQFINQKYFTHPVCIECKKEKTK